MQVEESNDHFDSFEFSKINPITDADSPNKSLQKSVLETQKSEFLNWTATKE